MQLGLIPSKNINGTDQPLPRERDAWVCSEGDLIVLKTASPRLPSVYIAGRKLSAVELIHSETGFVGRYEFLIDTWAGRTVLELEDGVTKFGTTLEIAPSDRKLGPNEFDQMLAELAARSPALIWGLSPGTRRGALASSTPAVVHPAVVSSQLPIFQQLLAQFLLDPPTTRQRSREVRPLDLTRRIDLVTLRWIGRRPPIAKAMRGETTTLPVEAMRTPIEQTQFVYSHNHPVTMHVAFLLRTLQRRFQRSADDLRKATGRPFRDPVIEAHAEILASRMDAAAAWARKTLSGAFFRKITPQPITETALQSIVDHPIYAGLQRVARRLLEPGLAYGPTGDLESALKHTYDLFELFVLYRLVEGLQNKLGAGWSLKAVKRTKQHSREERFDNGAAWLFVGPDGLTVELRYQQWFPRARTPPDDRLFSSLSGLNVPDFIGVLRRSGEVVSWVILDAKYRSGRQAVDQGLGDVHRYRDALRIRGKRAAGAFVVVPRLQESGAPYTTATYHKHHSFGVLQLSAPNPFQQAFQVLLAPWAGDQPA